MQPNNKLKKKKVALVLSGGGARGIAHIGVIEELEKQGYEIHSIAGTSMGALVGAIYAVGKMQEYKTWMCTLDKFEVFKLVDFTLNSGGFIKGNKIFDKLKDFIPDINIEDLEISYSATATDIINKKEIVFSKGSILEAVRASISIPTVFTPVKTENSLLVDGGVINNLPVNHVKRIKNDILIAVNVNADVPVSKLKTEKKENKKKQSIYLQKIKEFQNKFHENKKNEKNEQLNYFGIIDKTINLLTYQITEMRIEKYPPDILIKISRDVSNTFDFYKAEELVEIGRHITKETLLKS